MLFLNSKKLSFATSFFFLLGTQILMSPKSEHLSHNQPEIPTDWCDSSFTLNSKPAYLLLMVLYKNPNALYVFLSLCCHHNTRTTLNLLFVMNL